MRCAIEDWHFSWSGVVRAFCGFHRERQFDAISTAVLEINEKPALGSRCSPISRKLGAFVALSNDEIAALDGLHERRTVYPAGRDMVHEGEVGQSAYVLASGWVCSYKLLPEGTRQIVDFQIPGDFLGLRSVLFRTADHNVVPITKVEASKIRATDLLDTFSKTPRLAAAVLWAASRDEAMVVEHLVGIGRRDAKQRVTHFLLELGARLNLVGLGSTAAYACPLSQTMLGDALGLSGVHVNRVLRELHNDGLLSFHHGRVVIHNLLDLISLSDFDKTYLDHDGPLLK